MICGAASPVLLFLFYAVEGLFKTSVMWCLVWPGVWVYSFFSPICFSVNNLFRTLISLPLRFGSLALIYLLLFGLCSGSGKKVFTLLFPFLHLYASRFSWQNAGRTAVALLLIQPHVSRLAIAFCFWSCSCRCVRANYLYWPVLFRQVGGYKMANLKTAVAFHTRENIWFSVHLVSLHTALEAIDFTDRFTKIIVTFFWSQQLLVKTFLDYGGRPCTATSRNWRNQFRTALLGEEKTKTKYTGILCICRQHSSLTGVASRQQFLDAKLDDYGLWLIKTTRLPHPNLSGA